MKVFIFLVLVSIARASPVRENPMENEGLFEGDIMGIDPNIDRNAIPRDANRWPNANVPYVIDKELNPIWNLLMSAMRHIEERSCIRFFPKEPHHKDYIRIVQENGCWSFWGRQGRGEQKVSLGHGCHYFGTIVHELLHAIGFEHEHNRSDRDDYLTINWHNIEEKWYYAFRKLLPQQNRLLTPFDYNSIMLYGETAFSKDGVLKTIVAKDGRFLPANAYKKEMSESDAQRIRLLYECKSK
ncbi:Zinc metalloproteinase nas-39, partial [Stegodyphus mimosarum]